MELIALGVFLALFAGYLFIAIKGRKPGEKWTKTLIRPFHGGGPGEE